VVQAVGTQRLHGSDSEKELVSGSVPLPSPLFTHRLDKTVGDSPSSALTTHLPESFHRFKLHVPVAIQSMFSSTVTGSIHFLALVCVVTKHHALAFGYGSGAILHIDFVYEPCAVA